MPLSMHKDGSQPGWKTWSLDAAAFAMTAAASCRSVAVRRLPVTKLMLMLVYACCMWYVRDWAIRTLAPTGRPQRVSGLGVVVGGVSSAVEPEGAGVGHDVVGPAAGPLPTAVHVVVVWTRLRADHRYWDVSI